ncbi:Retrovirus-related Pol polyprotein from transposon TNT 1-94 [Vitis vinifera]|uniref:Retrovirus-related Pol polyprotein from transposon TNT 1-94 n=1 Tax=Vitis vinifera TaxID=29760 RepID=A0A438EME3_VITVI|nr:Retrovirus-related Pol polyprotein from transposon TNT 1-94 [Vitis vinifera]
MGIRNLRNPSEKESKLKVDSDIGIDVEHIGIVVLELDYVEKQLGKVIKIVRSDRDGEYYGKHGEVGQQKGPFARRNRTLMEMKRSMMSRSNLPEYLWGEAIKTATYILNCVPNSRTTRCYFIGYPSHSKGYKFYCSTRGTRVVESQVAKFLDLDVVDSIPSQSNERVEPMDIIFLPLPVSDVNLNVGAFDSRIQQGVATVNFPTIEITPIVDEIPTVEMRRSQRTRRLSFSNDYYVYLGNGEYDIEEEVDPTTYREALRYKLIGCKWVIKTKRDNKGNVERYKARLIMVSVSHFDLEFHQINVKTTFLNGDLSEEVYMSQPEGFEANGKENMDFKEASFVLGIEIYRDRSRNLLGLSQRAYINHVLKRFNMQMCKTGDVPIVKGDKISNEQCPKNDLEKDVMKTIPYASVVGSLMYAQVAAKKVIRYLQRTKDFMFVYRRVDNLEVVGYSDSDFGGCSDDRKSTLGYIFMLAGGVISWKSVKHSLIASSTMYVEFVACYGASSQVVWLRNLISEFKLLIPYFDPL